MASPYYNLQHVLAETIEVLEWLSKPGKWLVAVSGGADSMALLDLLWRWQEENGPNRLTLHVGHLNHLLRGQESDADAVFVMEEAQRRGIPFTIAKRKITALAKARHESIETTARHERYDFLEQTAHECRCDTIVTAHHRDDQVETILLRLLRGTGIRGLGGIQQERTLKTQDGGQLRVIRPLLNVSRKEIEAYLQEREVTWREDSSNQALDYTRNKVRHELLPLLREQYNPQVDRALTRLSITAGFYSAVVNELTHEWLAENAIFDDDYEITLLSEGLEELLWVKKQELVWRAIEMLGVPMRPIGYEQLYQALDVLEGEQTGCTLPGRVQVSRSEKWVHFTKVLPEQVKIPLVHEGTTLVGGAYIWYDRLKQVKFPLESITIEQDETAELTKWADEEIIDADKIHGQLVVQTWHHGQRMTPLGAGGSKPLGDLFTDEKVPKPWRERLGIVCDDEGVVWVVGLRLADRVKVDHQTKCRARLSVTWGDQER